jgi:hypothetical protein
MDMKRHMIICLYISMSMGREKQCCNYNNNKKNSYKKKEGDRYKDRR